MTEVEDAMWEWSGPVEERNRPWRHSLSLNGGIGEQGIQQTPSSQPWREHGKSDISGGVHVLVCCCNEEEEELKVMLSTFRSDKNFPCRVRLTFIVETPGYSPGDFTTRSETYEVLKQLLRVEEETDNQSFGDRGYIEHSGVLDKTFVTYDLIVKGPRMPRGKRSSLLVFFNEILPIKIACGQAEEPDVVYILDADSGHPEMGLMEVELMWRLLMSEPETACLTCPVRPVNPFESLLASSQYLEQAAVWDHVGESYFALQTTCRGAQCMLKYKCLVEDRRLAQPPRGEGAMPPVLDSLDKTAAAIPSLILLDTSPSEGLLVLLRQRRFDVRSCGLVDAVTCVPNSWLEFYAQRRRWYAGSLVAVLSSLRGKETYVECARNRWIASIYALVFNVHLHSGLVFLPVLLAKGIFRIARHIDRSDPDSSTAFGVGDAAFEWRVFAMVWAFLVVNVALYVNMSHKQLWMWINVSSVLWMLLCLAVLVGSAFAVTPLIILAVVLVPLIVGGLNFARGSLSTWACLALSAIPYVLITAVHSVLVLLYALSTLDSTEWGTRDVGAFDSGVIRSRARRMQRDTWAILVLVIAASAGVGVLLMLFSAYILFVVTAGLPALAYFLKLLLSIFPRKLEISRQKMVLGATDARPLSLRRHMVEIPPIHGRAEDPSVGRYISNPTVSRSRKASMSKSPTEIGSYVTGDEDTPSLDDASVSPGEGGTFFGAENAPASGVRINGASPAAASARALRQEISGTPTVASGFASTVVNPGRGGSRSRSRSRSRSPSSRREKARRDMQRIEGTGEESRKPSGRKESTSRRRSKSTGNSRSRSRSKSPSSCARAPGDGDGGSGNNNGRGGGVAMAGEARQCGKSNRLPNRPPSFRSGFSGLFSSADGSPSLRMLNSKNSKRERQVVGKPNFCSDTGGSSAGHGSDAPVERPKKQSRASIEEDPGRVEMTTAAQSKGESKFLNTRDSVERITVSGSPENGTATAGGTNSSRGRGGHLTTKSDGGGGVDFSALAKEAYERRMYGGRGGSDGFRRSWSLGTSPRDSLDGGGTETKEQKWKEENKEDARGPTPEALADAKANAVAQFPFGGSDAPQVPARAEPTHLLRPSPVGQDLLLPAQRERDGSHPNEETKSALDASSDVPRDVFRAAKQNDPEWRKHDASYPDPDTGLAGQSTSEIRDVVSDLPVPGSAGSSRQRHAVVSANSSARARAGSQDSDSDLEARRRSGCPSPATVNAILNSRIGAMSRHDLPYGAAVGGRGFVSAYNKGYESAYKCAYKHHSTGYVVDEESPYRGGRGGVGFGQSLRGIYSNLAGSSMMESEDDTESDSTLPMRSSTGVATRQSSAHQAAVLQMEAHLMGTDMQEMPTHSPAHQAAILEMEAQEMESAPRQMQTYSEAHQAAVLEMEAQFMEREPQQTEAPSAAHQAAVLEMEAHFMAREPRQIEPPSAAHQAAAQRMETHLLGRGPQNVGTPSAAHQAAARLMGAHVRTREPQHVNAPSAAHQAAAHLMETHLMGTEEDHQMEAQELEFLDAAGQQGYDRAAAQIAAVRQAAAREAAARQVAARQAAARQVAAQQAAARHVAAQQAVVRQAAARHKAARQAAIENTGPQRNWGTGQSSVFETSGSSSSDDERDSNSRGLRGVQVLDPVTPGGGVHRPKPTVVDSAGLVKANQGRGIPGSPSPGTPSRMGVNMKGPLSHVSGTPTSSSIRHSGGVVTHVPGTPSKAIRNSGSVASHVPGTPSRSVGNLAANGGHPGNQTPAEGLATPRQPTNAAPRVT